MRACALLAALAGAIPVRPQSLVCTHKLPILLGDIDRGKLAFEEGRLNPDVHFVVVTLSDAQQGEEESPREQGDPLAAAAELFARDHSADLAEYGDGVVESIRARLHNHV